MYLYVRSFCRTAGLWAGEQLNGSLVPNLCCLCPYVKVNIVQLLQEQEENQ